MFTKKAISELFTDFKSRKVMVIGDVMIDSYLFGDVNRISPEAPVPIVDVNKRQNHLGGAANVALNIKALGGTPFLCGVIGEDDKGKLFKERMMFNGLDTRGLLESNQRPTTTKFRIFGNNKQLLRVDEESTQFLSNVEQHLFLETLRKIVLDDKPDVILFQDYDKGVISKELIQEVNEIAKENNIAVVADPKRRNFNNYKHITLLKPNLKELSDGMKVKIDPSNKVELTEAVLRFKRLFDIDIALVTLSEYGVLVAVGTSGNEKIEIFPAHMRSIADVSGAGDTVISTAALCMASGMDPFKTAIVSNLAGGLVCEEVGVIPVDKSKLINEMNQLYTF